MTAFWIACFGLLEISFGRPDRQSRGDKMEICRNGSCQRTYFIISSCCEVVIEVDACIWCMHQVARKVENGTRAPNPDVDLFLAFLLKGISNNVPMPDEVAMDC